MIIVQREGLILGECGQVHTLGPGRSQGRDSRILQGGMNHGVVLEQTTQAEAHNHQQKVIEVAAHSLLKPARQGSIAISASQIIGFFLGGGSQSVAIQGTTPVPTEPNRNRHHGQTSEPGTPFPLL